MRVERLMAWGSVAAIEVAIVAAGCGGGGSSSSGAGASGTTGSSSSTGTGGLGGTGGAGSSTASSSTGGTGGAASSSAGSATASSSTGTGGSGTGGTGGIGGTGSGTGGAQGGLDAPCNWPGLCDPGLYCKAPGCGAGKCADPVGNVAVSPVGDPICGCDDVTYWNADVASNKKMSTLAAPGACAGGAIACDAVTPCPGNMICNRPVADQASCASPGAGTCWQLPIQCPLDGPMARACTNLACQTTCALIASKNPWFDDGSCP